MTTQTHRYLPDPGLSVARGRPLAEETCLGELTLPGFLLSVTAQFDNREALVQYRDDARVERWLYRDLRDNAMAVAKSLIAAGLGKGERVGILMTNRAEFLAATFGTALAGGVAVPLSTFSTPQELEYLLSASACSNLLMERQVLTKDFAAMLVALDPAMGTAGETNSASEKFPFLRLVAMVDSASPVDGILTWESFIALGSTISEKQVLARAGTVKPADPAALFFSSGSTALPKGILGAHRGVSIQLWRMGPQQGLGDGVRSWTANGFFWSGNFSMIIGGTLSRGGCIVLQRTFQPEQALELMAKERVSFLFAWPHQWEQLTAAANWATTDLSALKYIDRESAIAQHPTVESSWVEPRHCYGNSETFTLSTAYPAHTSREEAADSHGLPLPGNSLKIVEPLSGRVMPVGESGEIAVKGPTLMLGYLGVPLDETLDDEGYFHTGDSGFLDAEGRLHWEGRLNDIIKTGGANVSPLEIDEVIRQCPGVRMSQTVGVPHSTLGELVVTCVVTQPGESTGEAIIRDFAKQKLASYKVPRRVLFFDESDLQLTGSAKIRTADLRILATKRLEEIP